MDAHRSNTARAGSSIDVDLVCLENNSHTSDKMSGLELQQQHHHQHHQQPPHRMDTTADLIDSAECSRSPTNYLLNQRIGDLSVGPVENLNAMEHSSSFGSTTLMPEMTTEDHLLQVIHIKTQRINELENIVRMKDNEIAELTSHLDKFQSVFPFSNRGGRKSGVQVVTGQRQRTQGISAEPQNESTILELNVTFPKYDKEER